MNRTAIGLALLSALAFGAGAPLAKVLVGSADPWILAGLLYLGAGAGLATVRAIAPPTREAPLRRSDLPVLGAVIVSGGVLGPVLLMAGLARTDAATASLALNVEAIATMAIAWVVHREPVDRRLALGALAIVAGAALLAWSGPATFDAGALLVAAACVCWAVDNNASRELGHVDPVTVAMVKGLVAGTINAGLGTWAGGAAPPMGVLGGALAVGAVAYGASLVLYLRAMRDLGAARTSAYFSLAPFAGVAIAVAWLGEPITVRLATAAAFMAVGLWLHVSERHEHEHDHPALEHEHGHVHDEHHRHGHEPDDPPGEPHSHAHRHGPLRHRHMHTPDLHHRHPH